MPIARLPRLLVAALLPALVACAHGARSPATWVGDYAFGQSRLQLHASGAFEYQGGHCFPDDADVGLADEFTGRYRLEDRWLVLEPLGGAPAPCSRMGLKLYTVRADGHGYLFDESYLRALVNEVRDGKVHADFPTWHRTGEPEALPLPLAQWLPDPYAEWLRNAPPSGRVIAVGPVEARTRYGAAGRIDGEEYSAVLRLDIGRDQGAFPGMRLCVDGLSGKTTLDEVDAAESTLRWRWYAPEGGPPKVGTRVGGACPTAP